MHLKDAEAIVLCSGHAFVFGLLLLDVVKLVAWLAQVHFCVEPSSLQLQNLVGGLAHDVGHTLCTLQTGRAVWHHHVFSRDEHRHLTAQVGVVVDLLERRASDGQRPQQLLLLGAILLHHLGQLVVHVLAHAGSSFCLLGRLFADDLCLDRTCSGERLHD